MKLKSQRTIGLATLGVMAATTLGGIMAAPVQASESNKWKNLTILGGAVTGYGLLKHNKTATIVGGVGAVYAYSRYHKAHKREKRSAEAEREAWYRHRYGRNWRSHYAPGS